MLNKFLSLLVLLIFSKGIAAQSIFSTDTFTYTINLDFSQNLHLKSLPVDLLKGYCKGDWNAYYPMKEYNQCFFDELLDRFYYAQQDVKEASEYCIDNYCGSSYLMDFYRQFTRKLKYKEVLSYDARHSVVTREVLSIQVFFSRFEDTGEWRHYNGPVFWLKELNSSGIEIKIFNKSIRSAPWSLQKEFQNHGFTVNENKEKDNKKKIGKYDRVEEN